MKKILLFICICIVATLFARADGDILMKNIDAFRVAERCSSYVEVKANYDPRLAPCILTTDESDGKIVVKTIDSDGLQTIAKLPITDAGNLSRMYSPECGYSSLRNICISDKRSELQELAKNVDFDYLFIVEIDGKRTIVNEKGDFLCEISDGTYSYDNQTFTLTIYQYYNSTMTIISLAALLEKYSSTSINNAKIDTEEESQTIYNISGFGQDKETKGINILKGKKYIIR